MRCANRRSAAGGGAALAQLEKTLTSHKTGTTCFIGENFEKITAAAGGLKSWVLVSRFPGYQTRLSGNCVGPSVACSFRFVLSASFQGGFPAVFTHLQLPDMKIRSGLAQNTLATIAICLSWQTAGRCGW